MIVLIVCVSMVSDVSVISCRTGCLKAILCTLSGETILLPSTLGKGKIGAGWGDGEIEALGKVIFGRSTLLLGSSWGISMIFLAESSLVSFNALADRLKID